MSGLCPTIGANTYAHVLFYLVVGYGHVLIVMVSSQYVSQPNWPNWLWTKPGTGGQISRQIFCAALLSINTHALNQC